MTPSSWYERTVRPEPNTASSATFGAAFGRGGLAAGGADTHGTSRAALYTSRASAWAGRVRATSQELSSHGSAAHLTSHSRSSPSPRLASRASTWTVSGRRWGSASARGSGASGSASAEASSAGACTVPPGEGGGGGGGGDGGGPSGGASRANAFSFGPTFGLARSSAPSVRHST